MQTTLAHSLSVTGTGLHSGMAARVVLRPAPAGTGIVFRRMDALGAGGIVPARWDRVEISPLNTRIVNASGVSVSTIEHLMAALAGTGIHNAIVEIDGPEVPVLDGSAAPWVRAILDAGLTDIAAPLSAIEILETVNVGDDKAWARIEPASSLQMSFTIDFEDAAIGHQEKTLDLANGAFVRELCDSRTFCRSVDVEAMRARGLALGGSILNAVVVDGDRVLTPGGLRHPDEAVRHKMLDAMGDLYTAGAPILGRYTGMRAGHALTNRLLREVFARPTAWRMIDCDEATRAVLPGAGVERADLAYLQAAA